MIDFLSYGFMQRALVAGVLLGVTCAVLAFFVVLRRMAFIGVGISHAALGGVAVGLLVGLPPLLSAILFSLGIAWVIGWVSSRGRLSEDAAIGIFFPTAMAIGVALISLSATYRQDLMAYLFGSILSVRPGDLWLLLALTGGALSVLALFFKEFLFLSVDEEAARAVGVPVVPLRYTLLTVTAVTIVAAIKLVGIVLVSAFLVIPAATGQTVARSMRGMLAVSILAALVSVVGGLWLSWLWNLPSGAAIVLLSAALFFAGFLVDGRRRSRPARTVPLLLLALAVQAPAQTPQPAVPYPSPLDAARIIADVGVLSADSMEGRRTGTAGNERARRYLLHAFSEIGLMPFGTSYERPFLFRPRGARADSRGVNVVGWIRGSKYPDRYIVVTAHYDHLGIVDGSIYHGADDNASGTAGLLALARYFRTQPPLHSLVFAALDAEERGLSGARAFLADPPVDRGAIAFNVNLDMVSRNERDELYAAGTYHYPRLLPLVRRLAETAPVTLLAGHDRPDLSPGDDWTHASDHGPFHEAGIPFLYFGVEDHEDYHRPTDTFANIDADFLLRAVETVRHAVELLDAELQARRPSDSSGLDAVGSSPAARSILVEYTG